MRVGRYFASAMPEQGVPDPTLTEGVPSTSLASSALRGTLFTYIARYGGQLLGFTSTIVLARTLSQADFGLAGYALLVTGFLEVLRGLGIGAALIYLEDEPGRRDTAFYLAIAAGLLLYGVTWLVAPFAASFFGDERVTAMTRTVALTMPLAGFATVHRALLDKRLAFNRRLVPELGRGAGKALIAIALALSGFGAWSIVWAQVGGVLLETILLWWALPWTPSTSFQREHARPLLGYGGRFALVDSLGVLLLNIDYLIIGRVMGAASLGAYTVAFRIPELVVKQLSAVVGSVTFPVYAAMRHDLTVLRSGYIQSLRYLAMALTPLAVGLALVAEPLVLLLFGDRWSNVAPLMQALALYSWVRGVTFGSGSVLRAIGRPGLLVVMSAVQLALLVPALWWSASSGNLVTVAWTQVGVVTFSSLLRLYLGGRYVGVSLGRQLGTLLPSLGASIILILVVVPTGSAINGWPLLPRLALLVVTGAASYAIALYAIAGDDVRKLAQKARHAILPSHA